MACLLRAVWSGPDIKAIGTALKVAKSFDGAMQLGGHPFDALEEVRAHWPEIEETAASPLWIILRDSVLLAQTFGVRSAKELKSFVSEALR